jgi:hypothetical protein
MRIAKLWSLIVLTSMGLSVTYADDMTDIKCTSTYCSSLTPEQMDQINRVIEEKIADHRDVIDTRLNSPRVAEQSVAIVVNTDQVDLFGAHFDSIKSSRSGKMELAQTPMEMSFRVDTSADRKTYFAANTFLKKSDDDKYSFSTMQTVGFGQKFKKDLKIEIGLLKYPTKKGTSMFASGPDGLVFIVRKKY